MMMPGTDLSRRRLSPEILDGLPPDHPAAIRSYRDLARLNWVMGNFRFIRRSLRTHGARGGLSCLELGSGDGRLGGYLQRRPPWPGFRMTGLDLKPRGRLWPRAWEWRQEDILQTGRPASGIVVANLVLHHFSDAQLIRIGPALRNAEVIVVSEPARASLHRMQMGLLRIFGPDPVTVHDADVSIRAGFRFGELPLLLGLQGDGWRTTEEHHFRGAYRLTAVRRHTRREDR